MVLFNSHHSLNHFCILPYYNYLNSFWTPIFIRASTTMYISTEMYRCKFTCFILDIVIHKIKEVPQTLLWIMSFWSITGFLETPHSSWCLVHLFESSSTLIWSLQIFYVPVCLPTKSINWLVKDKIYFSLFYTVPRIHMCYSMKCNELSK